MAEFSEAQPATRRADIGSTATGGFKLRVLHIVESYPPDYGGGAAITTRDICRGLSDRGHDVRVLTVESTQGPDYHIDTEYDGAVRVDRINLPYFKNEDPDGWALGIEKWRRHQRRIDAVVAGLVDEARPDLVDYHTVRPFGEQVLETLSHLGVPIVATLHEAWLVCSRLMLLRSPSSAACEGPSLAKCLWCAYSHYDRNSTIAAAKLPWRVAKLGVYPAARLIRRRRAISAVGGAIARSKFMANVHEPHIKGTVTHIALGVNRSGLPAHLPSRPRNPLRFGFMAGFQPTKGLADVLNAAAGLRQRGKSFELYIWGPGQTEANIEEISRLGLKDCVFLKGLYTPEECWDAYNLIDVAVMATTVCEPMGRIPLEAAAAGAPTIAPAIGGITENIIDGVSGLLYRFRDGTDLGRQMARVLDEPDLVRRLIDNLPQVPDVRDRIAAIEGVYLSALGRSPAPARPEPAVLV